MIYRIKIILGILIAISLFLPLGSCEKKQVAKPTESSEVSISKDEASDIDDKLMSKSERDYLIIIKDVSLKEPGTWISLFAFLWPIPFLVIKNKVAKSKWKAIIANIIELLFVSFSIYYIYFTVLFFWYDPTVWGYLAVLVISIYALLYLSEMFLLLKKYQQTEI